MKRKGKLRPETYERMAFLRIGNRAVREAQAENHRLGLPNAYSRNGNLIYEMPDCEIIVKKYFQKIIKSCLIFLTVLNTTLKPI